MLTGAAILPIWKGEIIKEDSMSVYETFFDIISAQKERKRANKSKNKMCISYDEI